MICVGATSSSSIFSYQLRHKRLPPIFLPRWTDPCDLYPAASWQVFRKAETSILVLGKATIYKYVATSTFSAEAIINTVRFGSHPAPQVATSATGIRFVSQERHRTPRRNEKVYAKRSETLAAW